MGGEPFFRPALEHDCVRAVGVRRLAGFVPPDFELLPDGAVTRRVSERLLIRANGSGDVALVVDNLSQEQRCRRQPRLELQGLAEELLRGRVAAQQMLRRTRAEMKRGVARLFGERLTESGRRLFGVPLVERVPSGFGRTRSERLGPQ